MMNQDHLELQQNCSSDSSLSPELLEQEGQHSAEPPLPPPPPPPPKTSSFLPRKDLSGAVDIFLRQAEVYLEQEQWENAIVSCQRAIALNGNTAKAHKLCGEALQSLGNVADAMGAYAEALAIQPDYADVYVNMGQLYESRGDWDRAVEVYQTAIELHPGLVSAYRYLAKAWEKLEKPANHVDSIYQTLSLSPETFTSDEHCEMGQWLLEQGQEREAIECFQRAVALEPNHQESKQKLMLLLKKQENGELTDAVPLVSDASSRTSMRQWQTQSTIDREESIDALVILANSYVEMGNVEKAITYYEDALELDPNNLEICRELINLLNQSGQYEQALELQYRVLQSSDSQISADDFIALGDQLLAYQQLAKATACYHCAIQIDAESILAYQKLIHVLKLEGHLHEVGKAYLALAQILNAKNNTKAAISILEDGVEWFHQRFSPS